MKFPRSVAATVALDCLLLIALSFVLIRPLARTKHLNHWESIEATFIADARMLAENWPRPQWQPNWYLGTRFDYIYPPALRYGTAALVKYYPNMLPAKAYHIYISFFFCIGIAGVYFFTRAVTSSRWGGWLSALGVMLLSPSFLLLPDIRGDSWYGMPQRLSALVRYGEGPHMTALALIPIALAASWFALTRFDRRALVAAAIGCALVVSNNFYGATALTMTYPVLVWSIWLTHQRHRMPLWAAAIPLLGYGLTAFWLTPSYLSITLNNMKLVSVEGNLWSRWVMLAAVIFYLTLTERYCRGWINRTWHIFLGGVAMVFGITVLGNAYFQFRIIGEPQRLVPELDWICVLIGVECLRRIWKFGRAGRVVAAVVTLAAFSTSVVFVSHARSIAITDSDYQRRIEYRMSKWIHDRMAHQRVFATGSLRFWLNAWFTIPQVGGGSEQGVLNEFAIPGSWEITMGEDPEMAILWLKAYGADGVAVHEERSQEMYHDFVHPNKFREKLELVYESGEGDFIYRIPRHYWGICRVVDKAKLAAAQPIRNALDRERLEAYVDMLEKGPDVPVQMTREGPDVFRIDVRLREGQSLVVMENYAPTWRAHENGRQVPVRRDPNGYMVIDGGPGGDRHLRFQFETPRQNRLGEILTAASVSLCGVLLFRRRRVA